MESRNKTKELDLILDSINPSDIPFILNWFNDKNLGKFMDDNKPNEVYTIEDLRDYYLTPKDDEIYFTIRHNNKPIGFVQVYNITNRSGEFSFLIDQNLHGKGLGVKAVSKLCEKAKENNFYRLTCSIYKENTPSIRAIEKNEFKKITQTETEIFYEKNL